MSYRDVIFMPCGSRAVFDDNSGISYRCETCLAVVGSIGQPQRCRELIRNYEAWKILGGQGWNYRKGCAEE